MSAICDELHHPVDGLPEGESLGPTALVTAGRANKLAAFVMCHLLPRTTASAITGRAVKGFDAP